MKKNKNERGRNSKSRTISDVVIKSIYVIVMSIVMCYIAFIAYRLFNPDAELSAFGLKLFRITSNSMDPQFNIDDVVVSKKVNSSELNIGDIISFESNQEVVTHRIIGVEKTGKDSIYITKGDNNEIEDLKKVSYNQIKGKVVKVLPNLGRFIGFIKNKVTFSTLIAMLIISYRLQKKKIIKKIERKDKRIVWEQKIKKAA